PEVPPGPATPPRPHPSHRFVGRKDLPSIATARVAPASSCFRRADALARPAPSCFLRAPVPAPPAHVVLEPLAFGAGLPISVVRRVRAAPPLRASDALPRASLVRRVRAALPLPAS